MSKFIRTCMKCSKNFYSAGEYKEHMQKAHSKNVAQSQLSEARTVDNSLSKEKSSGVPESILVKPKKVEEKEATVAKNRKRRKSDKSTQSDEVKENDNKSVETKKEAPAKRGRRSTKKTTKKDDKE